MALPSRFAELHSQFGATMGEYFGCTLPDRYVEPKAECRYAREVAGIFDTNYFAVFSFSGPDAARYLNAISTNKVLALESGRGVRGLLLNPQGKILAELTVLSLPDRLLAITHACARERTARHLEKYIIMDDVQFEDWSERWASLAVEGSQLSRIAKDAFGIDVDAMPMLAHREVQIAGVNGTAMRTTFFGEVGLAFLMPIEHFPAIWKFLYKLVHDAGGGPIGYAGINAMRLEAGIPWFSYDFDETVIPHEAGLETSHISYDKGCYTGQEIVERVRSRGQVHRRLMRLQFLGLQIPPAGTKLYFEEIEAGTVTSAAISPRLGRVLGLGYIRREHGEAGTALTWSGGEAEVI